MPKRKPRRRPSKPIAPYKSRYEFDIATNLKRQKMKFVYEDPGSIAAYHKNASKAECMDCGSANVGILGHYSPDFTLANGIIIEGKGRFVAADRKKILSVLASNNDITRDMFRMLFMQDSKLSAKSTKRYSDWCDDNDIEWDIGPEVPQEWLK